MTGDQNTTNNKMCATTQTELQQFHEREKQLVFADCSHTEWTPTLQTLHMSLAWTIHDLLFFLIC